MVGVGRMSCPKHRRDSIFFCINLSAATQDSRSKYFAKCILANELLVYNLYIYDNIFLMTTEQTSAPKLNVMSIIEFMCLCRCFFLLILFNSLTYYEQMLGYVSYTYFMCRKSFLYHHKCMILRLLIILNTIVN